MILSRERGSKPSETGENFHQLQWVLDGSPKDLL